MAGEGCYLGKHHGGPGLALDPVEGELGWPAVTRHHQHHGQLFQRPAPQRLVEGLVVQGLTPGVLVAGKAGAVGGAVGGGVGGVVACSFNLNSVADGIGRKRPSLSKSAKGRFPELVTAISRAEGLQLTISCVRYDIVWSSHDMVFHHCEIKRLFGSTIVHSTSGCSSFGSPNGPNLESFVSAGGEFTFGGVIPRDD
eukprot:100409-Prorocentrum_minimum.AAC.4